MDFFTTSHKEFQMCEDDKRSMENDWMTYTKVAKSYALKPLWSRHFLKTHNAKGGIDLRNCLVFGFCVNNENT
jgi:hypothetical protein